MSGKILSLFDGMACGMIAMMLAGVDVESYDAYEIDKYAVKTAQHNFPMIQEHGDVFTADFTQYDGVDFLVGGSPCTYWSIAQTKNRETVASGMGWELFSQYVRALREAKPRYFIYENNKSMSKQIRASIDEAFGFEAVLINSALVSAQNRQRLYWVGKRNADGTYSKVDVEQPEDRGILLKDVLDSADAQDFMSAEPTNTDANGKAFCVTSRYYKGFGNNPGKCLEKHRDSMVAEPLQVGAMPRPNGELSTSQAFRVYGIENKSVTINSGGGGACGKTGLYAVPVMPVAEATAAGYTDIECGDCVDLSMPNSKTRRGRNMADKSNCMQTSNEFYQYVGYAIDFDENGKPIKAIGKDGKQITVYEITVYEVRDGQITIKGKQYPIKLRDGHYIIRKLTVNECKRLQTVPEWYDFSCVSNSRAYKMLGNGWTCEVIAHLIRACICPSDEKTVETE